MWAASRTGRECSPVTAQCVCDDRALRSWILGFGALARVVSPSRLARDIAVEMNAAAQHYTTPAFAPLRMVTDSRIPRMAVPERAAG